MPRFEHDCTGCIYQGIVDNYDVYFHPSESGGGTMVYRYATDNDEDGYGLYISQSLTKISRDPRVPWPDEYKDRFDEGLPLEQWELELMGE